MGRASSWYKTIIKAVVLIILSYAAVKYFMDELKLIFAAAAISYILKPFQMKLMKLGIGKRLAAVLILLILVLSISVGIFFFIPSLLKETANLSRSYEQLSNHITFIGKQMDNLNSNPIFASVNGQINTRIHSTIAGFSEKSVATLLALKDGLLSMAVLPAAVYYFLVDGRRIIKSLDYFIFFERRRVLNDLFNDINSVLRKYIISQLTLSAIVGILTFIILKTLGVGYAVILSVVNGLFNFIPYFGPFFGALPALFAAMMISTKTALLTALFMWLLQQVEGDIISPKLTGECINIHPLAIIIILIIGGKLAGFMGMILAVPAAAAVKVILEDLDYYMF